MTTANINIVYIKRNIDCYEKGLGLTVSFTPPFVIRHERSGNEKGINITIAFEANTKLGKYLEIRVNLDLLFSIDLLDEQLFEVVLWRGQKDSLLELLSQHPDYTWLADLDVLPLRQDVVKTLYKYIQMQV